MGLDGWVMVAAAGPTLPAPRPVATSNPIVLIGPLMAVRPFNGRQGAKSPFPVRPARLGTVEEAGGRAGVVIPARDFVTGGPSVAHRLGSRATQPRRRITLP